MRDRVKPPLIINYLSLNTRIGEIWLGSTQLGIFRVHFGRLDIESIEQVFHNHSLIRFERGGALVEETARQILRYLEGRLRKFTVKLDLTGSTTFARRVWRATTRIPYGEVRSYGWLAARLGNPGSARAVGLALSRNPVPILVPCHRVVGSHGWLGGFSGGLRIKQYLLAVEAGQSVLDFELGE